MPRTSTFSNLVQTPRSRDFILMALFTLFCTACNNNNDDPISRDVHTTRCINDVAASDRQVYQCDGVEFKTLLTQECIDKPCGLIFDSHGWLSNADEQEGRSNLAKAAVDLAAELLNESRELESASQLGCVDSLRYRF